MMMRVGAMKKPTKFFFLLVVSMFYFSTVLGESSASFGDNYYLIGTDHDNKVMEHNLVRGIKKREVK